MGDFGFFKNIQDLDSLISRLNGKIILLYGNHDKWIKKNFVAQQLFASCLYYLDLKIIIPDLFINGRQQYQFIVLNHFPFLSWDKWRYGSWMLHGHIHGYDRNPNILGPSKDRLIMDVGVDSNNFSPISYEDVRSTIESYK